MKPTYEELEQQLAESHRALRAETTAHDHVKNQLEKMAAENAGLKAGIGFFSYDSSCSYEEHDTADKAAAYAEDSISEYRDNAPDGWSDEVGSVVWGVILQRATMTGLRPVTEDDNVAPDIEEWCDYTLLPGLETPATDAYLAEVRAQAHKEGAHFVANRMLAAWDAGFIDDTAKNAADIARMILTSTEFMADAPEGDFDRSFADGVLEDIAAQIRKGAQS